MQILPVKIFHNTKLPKNNLNSKKENQAETQVGITFQPQLITDTISFKRVAGNAGPLRKIMKYGVDIWTGKPVIPPETFEQILKKKEFNRTIKSIIKTIKPFKETLHKVPFEIFEMLEDYSKIHPESHLDSIIQQWTPLAQRELINIQLPIFNKLIHESKALPPTEREVFDNLMKTTKAQIEKKPITQNFNKKDFRYKLERIAQKIRQRNISEEVITIEKMIGIAEIIPSNIQVKNFKNNKKIGKNKRNNYDVIRLRSQQQIFRQLKNFFERSVLQNDKELQSLFSDVNCQIHGIPTFVPFGRLNFIESIKNIVDNIENKKLAKRLVQIASQIPTANQEVSAFIVKASRKPSEKIGYDLLWGSVGNIEHLKVYSKGGKDGLSNYAISTNYTNSERSNRTFAEQLRVHKESYYGAQIYIYKLIELYKNGILKKFGLNASYIKNLAKTFEKLSPSEKPLKIDLFGL